MHLIPSIRIDKVVVEGLDCNLDTSTISAMGVSDKALGGAMLLTAAVVFTYYTIWALILPLLPADSTFHDRFPSREWAVKLPAFILLVGLTGIGGLLGMVMMKEAQKKRAKIGLKSA